jgi:hypothetical protein
MKKAYKRSQLKKEHLEEGKGQEGTWFQYW